MGAFSTCIGCHGRRDLRPLAGEVSVCESCREELREQQEPRSAPLDAWRLTTHWAYGGLVRQLILRVKVQGDHRALRFLRALAEEARKDAHGLAAFDVVIPAPSSLYGRILGRIDLAGCVAADLARADVGFVAAAPFSLHARWRKRSRIKGRTAEDAGTRVALSRLGALLDDRWLRTVAPRLRGKRIGILDDVVTTGHTMLTTARKVAAMVDAEVELVGLASALKD